jgi:hypothetical protein
MNFLKHLKDQAFDHRYGNRDQVSVNRRALIDLINQFEREDSAERAAVDTRNLNINLSHAIEAVYRNNKCTETTLLIIMETLGQLIKERLKENDLKAVFRI